MSKGIKTIANIVLPNLGVVGGAINGVVQGGGVRGAIRGGIDGGIRAAGSMLLSPAVGTPIAGAISGAAGGYVSGGTNGAIAGALNGYAAGSLSGSIGDIASSVLGGTQAGDFLGIPAGVQNAASVGASPSMSAGEQSFMNKIAGATPAGDGGIARVLGSNITPISGTLAVANGLSTLNAADAAKEAAKIQAAAVDKAITTQAPYNELGVNAAKQIQQIQADPAAYVQNNPFYKSLADDAQQRLLANQAAKGKVGSGGTADALQTSLLNLGNGLVQQQVGTLQNQVNSGQGAASSTSGLQTDRGAALAGGKVGAANALQTGYQNQIATLLALQNLSKAPSYQPAGIARV